MERVMIFAVKIFIKYRSTGYRVILRGKNSGEHNIVYYSNDRLDREYIRFILKRWWDTAKKFSFSVATTKLSCFFHFKGNMVQYERFGCYI